MARPSEAKFRTALLHGEIQPFYQPQVDLRSGAVAGFEILARWRHASGTFIPPADFIPLAESTNLICELTRQLLGGAFQSAAALPPAFGLAVNISPMQLRNRALPSTIRTLAEAANFSLNRLTVEITESALLTNQEVIRRTALELRALGIKLSLDDFGTGYSSLKQLQALDFDEIKVDRSFVRTITTDRESRKIVSAVIGLGRSLGIRTVAEGVEEQEQADMLLCIGCDLGQGWLYGKPGPARVLERSQVKAKAAHTRSELSVNPVFCLEAMPTQGSAQLQAIYDGAPVGLCFLDCELRYVSLNRRLADFTGQPVLDHIGRTVQEVVPSAFALAEPYLVRSLAGEPIHGVELDVPYGPATSCRRTVLLSCQPARDEAGDVVGISVVVVDISDRRRMEEALRESEDHYRHMVELSPQIAWTADQHGNVLETSFRWHDLTGQDAGTAARQGWTAVVHPEDLAATTAAWRQAVASQQSYDHTFRTKNRTGGWNWVRARGMPRRDGAGNVLRWYGSTECIDSQKHHEKELQASADRLQAVLDTVPVGMVIAEAPSGRIVSRNPAARTILQQDPICFNDMEDYSRCVQYFRDGRKLEAHEFPLAQALLFGCSTSAQEVLYRSMDGIEKRIRLSGAPLRDPSGTIIGAVASIQEVHSPCEESELPPSSPA